jgi:hypothetical protein
MAQRPLFVRFIALWMVLLAVTAVSFYLALLLRVAYPTAALVCLTVALVCFAGLQIFQFSRLRFVRQAARSRRGGQRKHRGRGTRQLSDGPAGARVDERR